MSKNIETSWLRMYLILVSNRILRKVVFQGMKSNKLRVFFLLGFKVIINKRDIVAQ